MKIVSPDGSRDVFILNRQAANSSSLQFVFDLPQDERERLSGLVEMLTPGPISICSLLARVMLRGFTMRTVRA